ncbi:unnamed protein product [Effrenium voratum]|nr:unnamed protein product [Effrenium voratum]
MGRSARPLLHRGMCRLPTSQGAERGAEEAAQAPPDPPHGFRVQVLEQRAPGRQLRAGRGRLGFGSFGTIYLAKQKSLGFKMAVKKVRKVDKDPRVAELLMNEIHALMDLDHPNVWDGGPDLLTRLEREGKIPEKEAASSMRQMLAALKCCHDHYMGHFDVKPENFIYRTQDMTKLKMIDLGLASHFKRSRKEIRGTGPYMSPEMWDGFYGPEADVWGCGVVFFLMLTGEHFFPHWLQDEEIKPLAKDRKWIRQRLRKLRDSGLSKEAVDLVTWMMRLDRHTRPTIREALQHPFFQLHSEKEAARVLRKHSPEYAELDLLAKDLLGQLPQRFQAFASEPVLVRAALLLMAHVGAYSFNACRAQRNAFSQLDRTGSGGLCMEELEAYYEDEGLPVPDTLENAFSGIDVDDDGYITYIEFLSATLPQRIRCDEKFIHRVFEVMDWNGDGFIDVSDLCQAFMGGEDPRGICKESMAELGTARLSWDHFLELMQRPKAAA